MGTKSLIFFVQSFPIRQQQIEYQGKSKVKIAKEEPSVGLLISYPFGVRPFHVQLVACVLKSD